ncbi:hypothetical protein KM043_002903 [Ampulex compressa]|nr:hypothetical protein KM043_002903 [Ampulex compressa]
MRPPRASCGRRYGSPRDVIEAGIEFHLNRRVHRIESGAPYPTKRAGFSSCPAGTDIQARNQPRYGAPRVGNVHGGEGTVQNRLLEGRRVRSASSVGGTSRAEDVRAREEHGGECEGQNRYAEFSQ